MQIKESVVEIYSDLAPVFNEGEQNINDIAFGAFILENIEPTMVTALEVGCGVGRLAQRVAQHIPNVLGLDITPAMIDCAQARAKNGLKFVLGDVETYPFQQKFDFVYSVLVFDHVDRRKVFPILSNLLNPNGLLVVLDRFEYVQDLDVTKSFLSYMGWRRRHRLGINILPFLTNMKRASADALNPAWGRLDEICLPYHITQSEYAGMLKDILPSAQFDLVDQHTASVLYRKV